jgi:hypothetical protein
MYTTSREDKSPRCPYCDDRMVLRDWHDVFFGKGSFYECTCGARSPIEASQQTAYESARRSDPLTKKDLLSFDEPLPIYVKHRYGDWQQDGWHIWSPEHGDNDCEIANLENYGICWDAFLAKPD